MTNRSIYDLNRRTASGFTLVEMLVVITIVAMLIAILLPSLQAARRTAKFVLCASNMRQVGLIYLSYEAETRRYPSRDPLAGGWGALPERVVANGTELDPFFSDRRVFYCPD